MGKGCHELRIKAGVHIGVGGFMESCQQEALAKLRIRQARMVPAQGLGAKVGKKIQVGFAFPLIHKMGALGTLQVWNNVKPVHENVLGQNVMHIFGLETIGIG
jgi:hypothetical protein